MKSSSFTVFPAIDLRQGQVVRLTEGDPGRQTQYSSAPANVARAWITKGARWLHIVNLDGAFDQPDLANQRALKAILDVARECQIPVQFGGGMRSLEAVQTALEAGVTRVVLGTLAVEQPEVFEKALALWGSARVAVSLDARDGQVQVRGWQEGTSRSALEMARALKARGLEWLVFTDIARDGLQTGLNLNATAEMAQTSGLQVIASGGVSRLTDVLQARKAGLAGAIVGRALYEGTVDPQSLFALNQPPTEREGDEC